MFTKTFKSVSVAISFLFLLTAFGAVAAEAQTMIPRPILVFKGKQIYDSPFGKRTLYKFDVENKTDFPEEMFAAAPDLPPCGINKNSSRSWIEIHLQKGGVIYGFCALKSPKELDQLSFSLPVETKLNLDYVYIVINDRQMNREYKSTLVSTQEQ